MQHRRNGWRWVMACVLVWPVSVVAWQRGATSADSDVYTLGQITVTAQPPETVSAGDAVITEQDMWTFHTTTLDDAIKLTPGVTATLDSNGRRNEHDIFVRGFGRWQVPLSIDGVRVYLPADNRLDFRRFLTADLAEVQIKKGDASVIDGPGAMGGAINLVTRKPVRPFEARFQAGVDLARDGAGLGWNGDASLGVRRDRFYLHASMSYQDRDDWPLPAGFDGTSIQPPGARLRSASRDSRVNLKVGYTPNATDEYTLNYTGQDGSKGAPLNVHVDPPNPPNSYWDWPMWDIQNLYFLSNTQWGEHAYLKTKVYRNTFDNALHAYDDDRYTTQSANGRFRSLYADVSHGASVEYGIDVAPAHQTRFAAHWRRDRHREYNINRPTHPTLRSREPDQNSQEETWSLAAEHTWQATDALQMQLGASYDRNQIGQAQDYNTVRGLFEYPTGSSNAWNGQAAVYWQRSARSRFGATLSSRTRFATSFERFSTRFGTAVPNPDLGTERGNNLALSWTYQGPAATDFNAAVFYSDVRDMIQTVVIDAGVPQLTQTRNVGDGEYYGVEFGGQTRLGTTVTLGGNGTWMRRRIRDPLQPDYRATGIPDSQILLFVAWTPHANWVLTPSIEHASNRWNAGPGTSYLRTGRYTLLNLQAQWTVNERMQIAVGGRNLLDRDYALAWGFPEEGRTFQANLRMTF